MNKESVTDVLLIMSRMFDAIPAGSTARLRDFINQSDAVGVADFADKCLALFDH